MNTIRLLRIFKIVLFIIWLSQGIFLEIQSYYHSEMNIDLLMNLSLYNKTFNFCFISIVMVINVLPKYVSPSLQVYNAFKLLKKKDRKKFDKYISEYLSESFKNSMNYEVFKNLSFSPIQKINTQKISKRKYNVTISFLDEIKYTMLVIPEGDLVIDDIYGSGFNN